MSPVVLEARFVTSATGGLAGACGSRTSRKDAGASPAGRPDLLSQAQKQHEAPSIEDVIKEADVSRATFYLHFLSLEEAVNALGLADC